MSKEKLERHVRLLKEGDTSAFDYVYERTHRSVYFAALYVLHDKMLAEDAMQEAFVRAISVIGQYREGTNFTAWITTMVAPSPSTPSRSVPAKSQPTFTNRPTVTAVRSSRCPTSSTSPQRCWTRRNTK